MLRKSKYKFLGKFELRCRKKRHERIGKLIKKQSTIFEAMGVISELIKMTKNPKFMTVEIVCKKSDRLNFFYGKKCHKIKKSIYMFNDFF